MGGGGGFNPIKAGENLVKSTATTMAGLPGQIVMGTGPSGGGGPGALPQNYDFYLSRSKAQRNEDLAEGRARGEQIFKEGALGRLSADRAKEISDIVAQRKAMAQGFTPQERQVMEDTANQTVNQSTAQSLRALRGIQGANNVRGGMAAAQQGRVVSAGDQARIQAARDIELQNIAARRQGMDALEKSLETAKADEMFNLGQANKETLGRLTTELGYGSLGAAERGAVGQMVVGEQAAAAAGRPSGGKK